MKTEKTFFSELTASRIFPDLSAFIKSSFGLSFVFQLPFNILGNLLQKAFEQPNLKSLIVFLFSEISISVLANFSKKKIIRSVVFELLIK